MPAFLKANMAAIMEWTAAGESDEQIAERLGSSAKSVSGFRAKHKIHRPRRFEKQERPHTDAAIPEHKTDTGERKGQKPLQRRQAWGPSRYMIAYDLETTLIGSGTPEPLYITAYDEFYGMYSKPVYGGLREMGEMIVRDFLIPERNKVRYVAWNGNRFDNYLVGLALLEQTLIPEPTIRPYLNNKGVLRGFIVIGPDGTEREGCSWEFLDGISMTGILSGLDKFVEKFASDFPKGDFEPPFDRENPDHIDYAERDSLALYVAMSKANAIVNGIAGIGLQPTIGNLGIKFLKSRIPEDIKIYKPPYSAIDPIKRSAYRGGYTWCVRQYEGPVWKYDINQAYAGAMRTANLPHGRCERVKCYQPGEPGIYHTTFEFPRRTKVPFFYKVDKEVGFSNGSPDTAWITDEEYRQLQSEGWSLTVHDGFVWTGSFNFREMVDELESERTKDDEGPSGPLGTMVKALGNNSYGKMQEEIGGQEYLFAKQGPQDYFMLDDGDGEPTYVWSRPAEEKIKDYHQPQMGVFITAHVRMQVRRAALGMEEHFLYADTDCVAFSAPAPHLEISPSEYGKWKEEEQGEHAVFIAKKVYAFRDGSAHAKGISTDGLTFDDFVYWKETGQAPVQEQNQLNGVLRVMSGEPMYVPRTRSGTSPRNIEDAFLTETGEYVPITIRERQEIRQAREEHEYYARVDREFERDLARGLRRVILEAGGLRRNTDELAEEYAAVPRSVIRKDGLPGDVIAEYLTHHHPELGIETERDLLDALTRG